MSKYYDYFLRTNNVTEMEALAQGFGIPWDSSLTDRELMVEHEIEVEELIYIPNEDNTGVISVTQSSTQTRRMYISIVGDLPQQDVDGNIIYELNSDNIEVPVMMNMYHANIRSTHRIISPSANLFEVTPARPLRKFA